MAHDPGGACRQVARGAVVERDLAVAERPARKRHEPRRRLERICVQGAARETALLHQRDRGEDEESEDGEAAGAGPPECAARRQAVQIESCPEQPFAKVVGVAAEVSRP